MTLYNIFLTIYNFNGYCFYKNSKKKKYKRTNTFTWKYLYIPFIKKFWKKMRKSSKWITSIIYRLEGFSFAKQRKYWFGFLLSRKNKYYRKKIKYIIEEYPRPWNGTKLLRHSTWEKRRIHKRKNRKYKKSFF